MKTKNEVSFIKQGFEIMTDEKSYSNFTKFLEKCGRVCYKSEDRITGDSADIFVKGILKLGHESVLEHTNLSVKFITNRATTHALVRHRHCAFSQESTRFINYGEKKKAFVIEPSYLEDFDLDLWKKEVEKIMDIYFGSRIFLDHEQARSLLPNSFKTELIMTTNLRQWRHILKLRTASDCHPQMRHLMNGLLNWFKTNLPIFVKDIDIGFNFASEISEEIKSIV
jgi:thymidylate synthase (FAD)